MEIPVLDLAEATRAPDDALEAWRKALISFGALQIVNHGVPDELRSACLRSAAQFHRQDEPAKAPYAMNVSRGITGYLPMDGTPKQDGSGRLQRDYASLDIGPESVPADGSVRSILLGPNAWPELPGFRTAVQDYRDAVRSCAVNVAAMLARVCGLPPDRLIRHTAQGCSLLRLLHYPEPAQGREEPPNGHTDYEWFTLITQTSPGLEILQPDGGRIAVPARPDAMTLLIGDLLEVLTGGYLESTLHWVRSREPDRYSLTYFFGPDFDEVVTPESARRTEGRDYPPLHAGHHLTALRVRHLAHLRGAVRDGSLVLPFDLPATNPLKTVKEQRLVASARRPR
jgi:isopenicillin N synthase-like dioxygenase